MATEQVQLQGTAFASHKELLKGKKIDDSYGDTVVLVVRATVSAEERVASKHAGNKVTVKAGLSDVLVLTDEDADEYLEVIAKARADRYEKETGQQPLPASDSGNAEKNSGHGGDTRDK